MRWFPLPLPVRPGKVAAGNVDALTKMRLYLVQRVSSGNGHVSKILGHFFAAAGITAGLQSLFFFLQGGADFLFLSTVQADIFIDGHGLTSFRLKVVEQVWHGLPGQFTGLDKDYFNFIAPFSLTLNPVVLKL